MIWINGVNFVLMKEVDLFFGFFVEDLLNWVVVDVDGKIV